MSTESGIKTERDDKTERGIVIVTGSNGTIGDAVMRRFAGRFDDVVGFDRKAPNPPPPGCSAVDVDITSDESVREGLFMIREHRCGCPQRPPRRSADCNRRYHRAG